MNASNHSNGFVVGVRPIAGAVVLAGILGGCIPSESIDAEQFGRYWTLTADPIGEAEPYRPGMDGTKLPARWTFERSDSVILSTITMVRGFDAVEEGAEEVTVSISPTHTRALEDVLAEIRRAVEDLGSLASFSAEWDPHRWADVLAGTLVRMETISRMSGQGAGDESGGEAAPAEPMLRMFTEYLNQQSGGGLLAGLEEDRSRRLRHMLAQVTLRLGFAAAGKELPDGLRDEALERLAGETRPAGAAGQLRELLLERMMQAPPAPKDSQLAGIVRSVLKWTPRALEVLEDLLGQWDRVDRMTIELRRWGDRPLLTGTLAVRPGREVRIRDVVMFQPAMVFTGTSRVTLLPETPGTGEVALLYDTNEGEVELRFEGIVYALVRLFAFPLRSGRLREVRVFTGGDTARGELLAVRIFTEAGPRRSPERQLLFFQQVTRRRLERTALEIRQPIEKREQMFHYLTEDRRYTYRRVQTPEDR